ncbi:uncharacterized protein [Dermacentor albipictus]|uniref:uncharacterized protein n=1 Tax=Dermacentor albipictus TaxID=60249 RepID=UPI0038FC89E7
MSALIANHTTKTYLDEMRSSRVYHYAQVNTPQLLVGGNILEYITPSAKCLQLCETKRNVTGMHCNIVADNIQYEDFEDLCGYGSCSRLHILMTLATCLAENYTSPNQERACKLVT